MGNIRKSLSDGVIVNFLFFFLCYALHKDICPEKRALLFFSFLKMFLFYIVDLQSFISGV